jgi:hypothetical protein
MKPTKENKKMSMMIMMNNNLGNIIKRYVHTAASYGEAMERGDYNSANIYFDKNKQAFERMLYFGSRGSHALFQLLNHKNPHVRISSAIHLLNTYPKESLTILEELASSSGFEGFTAQMVLEDLKKGNITIPKFKDNSMEKVGARK